MARRYSVAGSDTNTASTTIIGIVGTTAVRPRVYYVSLGSTATPADNAGNYSVKRTTTAGTSTGVTPAPLDSTDPASTTTAGKAHSAEPTYTANTDLLYFSVNQRASYQWYAAPDSELIVPATASNGLGLLVNSIGGSAVAVDACFLFQE